MPTGVRLDFSDGYWLYIASTDELGYEITGKYLFFAPDPIVLLTVAVDEIVNHEFHMAKVNSTLLSGAEHVLCLYSADDSRRYELRDRYRSRTDLQDLRYRWWKSDAATHRGVYSEQFLSGLDSQRMGAFDKKGT